MDILNLLSHSQVSGASGNASFFLGRRLTRRAFALLQASQTEKQKTHGLNHILKYPVLDKKITPALGDVREAGGQVPAFGFHLKPEDSFGISTAVCDLGSHLI